MYILAKTEALAGILINLIVTVNGKYIIFVQNLYFVELFRLDPICIF